MKPDRDGHGFRAHVRNFRPHFEYTVLEAVSDIDGVSERKLFHPSRLFEEFQPACQPGRILIRFGLDYAPSIGCGKKTMNRDCAAHIPECHVERVSFSIRVKSLFIEPVRPRPNERNATERRPRLEFFNGGVRPAKDLLTFDLHGKGYVADRGKNGYGNLILRVFDDDDVGIAV